MTDGIPVRIATNGVGVAVTEAAQGIGCTLAVNGLGIPVVVKVSGGLPIRFVGPDAMASFAWIQGATTTLTDQGVRMRYARNGNNPRTYKAVTGLTIGATYRLQGTCYAGTQDGTMNFRVSTSDAIPDGLVYSQSSPTTFIVNATFVCPAATLYIGVVAIASTNGQYAEIDKYFSLTRVP